MIYYENKRNKSKQLSNVEFALLQLISENDDLSGYEINKLVDERGYREWANIGETSIYTGLDKLYKKEFVEFYIYVDKQGKGPLPKKFRLTDEGIKAFRAEILGALSSTRERDQRFDIGLAAISFVDAKEALPSLNRRKQFLRDEKERITRKFAKQDGLNLPKHIQLLFKHPLILIDAELGFIEEIINTLKASKENKHDNLKF